MLPNVGGGELVIVLVILLLLFGAKRIPELAKGLGAGIYPGAPQRCFGREGRRQRAQ